MRYTTYAYHLAKWSGNWQNQRKETNSFDKELKHSSIAYGKLWDTNFQFSTANHKLQFTSQAV